MPTPLLSDTLAASDRVRHGFFTRSGGISEGIYAGLNCGLGSADEAARVRENRRRAAAHMLGSAMPEQTAIVLTPNQVHSDVAVVVDAPWSGSAPRADALVTCRPGLVIGVLTADCAPVLMADLEAGVIAAAHAGWRGALGGILEATVATMVSQGADPRRIRAALGPCIGPRSYEVGPDFEAQFLAVDSDNARFFTRGHAAARPRFDLPGYVQARLSRLALASVENRSRCTYECDSELFSYRRTTHRGEPDYGRQLSAILLMPSS